MRSPRFAQLLLAAGALCAEASQPAGPAAGTPDDAGDATSIAAFARRLLRRRHRRLLREAKVALHGDALQRHALRIAAKKLRYAAEFFAPLFEREQARTYATALAGVQDVLGHANDAATAARLIGELAPAGDSPATAALRGAAAAATTAIDRDLGGAWEGFSRAAALLAHALIGRRRKRRCSNRPRSATRSTRRPMRARSSGCARPCSMRSSTSPPRPAGRCSSSSAAWKAAAAARSPTS